MILTVTHLCLLAFLIWLISKSGMGPFDGKVFWGGLGVRIVGGVCFASIHQYIGEGDTLAYFEAATKLADLAKTDFKAYLEYFIQTQHPHFQSAARDGFFIKILSVFAWGTNGNYWITTLYFSVLSFHPVWYLCKVIGHKLPQYRWSAILGFMILPSPIFWTSGILKDSLIVPAVFLLAAILYKVHSSQDLSWHDWILAAISLFLLFKLRYFVFGLMSLMFLFVVLHHFFRKRIQSLKIRYLIWSVVVCVGIFLISRLNYNLNFEHFPQAIYDNHIAILQASDENAISGLTPEPSWAGIIAQMPLGFITGLFRPLFGEGSFTLLIHQVENTILLLLIVFTFIYRKNIPPVNFLAVLCFGVIALLAATIPLAAPNFGTLMRYKAIYLPFLFYFASIVPVQVWLHRIKVSV